METIAINDLPVSVQFDFESGEYTPFGKYTERRLSDLAGMFYDQAAASAILAASDRLVYDIRYYHFITSTSDMSLGVTRIFPGKIGDEYHMTKGHFHERDDQPEIYFCVRGQGYLLMEDTGGDFHAHAWRPGTITHIPPFYAHRAVNTGGEPLIFVASYHLAAGHNYEPVVQRGFAKVVVERDGAAQLLPNPRR
jgi:glucose-6-phosphate isomerase